MLDRREAELVSEATDLRARLLPIDRELEEIRAAKIAVARVRDIPAKGAEAAQSAVNYWLQQETNAAYKSMTMKQLVRTALADHFKEGATANQMLGLFHATFGRTDIVRSSLSPQLSRLKIEGEIVLDGMTWKLAERETSREAQTQHDQAKKQWWQRTFPETEAPTAKTETPEA